MTHDCIARAASTRCFPAPGEAGAALQQQSTRHDTPHDPAPAGPHTRRIMSSVAATMAPPYASTAARRKAGLDSRRCRCHTGPSLTSRPLPGISRGLGEGWRWGVQGLRETCDQGGLETGQDPRGTEQPLPSSSRPKASSAPQCPSPPSSPLRHLGTSHQSRSTSRAPVACLRHTSLPPALGDKSLTLGRISLGSGTQPPSSLPASPLPSLSRSPPSHAPLPLPHSPARLLPGKKAVPSFTYTSPAASTSTARASARPVTSATRSPPSSSPTTGP